MFGLSRSRGSDWRMYRMGDPVYVRIDPSTFDPAQLQAEKTNRKVKLMLEESQYRYQAACLSRAINCALGEGLLVTFSPDPAGGVRVLVGSDEGGDQSRAASLPYSGFANNLTFISGFISSFTDSCSESHDDED